MKPISITMQGFGSYVHTTTVDFSSLGENPIFLITGATGGGKTTILDAMCFALYCKATGGRRSWTSMRSTAADDTLPTSVDFTFRLGDQVYRFCRYQSIYFVRGSGRRDIKEEHICYRLIDGCPLNETAQWDLLLSGSESKVRDYAEKLLGLTCEQFSQVIVLPQGDFLKLLRANSKEKAEILQTLFATQLWSQITNKMKVHANTLYQEVGELYATKAALLEREEAETIEALSEKCKQSETHLNASQAALNKLQKEVKAQADVYSKAKELQQLFTQHQELTQKQQELEALTPTIDEKKKALSHAKQIESLYPYWQNHQTAQQVLLKKQNLYQLAEQSYAEANQLLATLTAQQNHIKQKKAEMTQLEQSIPKLEETLKAAKRLETLLKEKPLIEQAMTKNKGVQADIELKQVTVEENIQKGTAYLQSIEKEMQLLPSYLEQLHILEGFQQQFEQLAQAQTAKEQAEQQYHETSNTKKQKEVFLQNKKKLFATLQAASMEHTATMMAKNLKENQPCPVCGSLHHPAPSTAHTTQESTDLQLTELTTQLEQLQADYEQYLQIYSRAQAFLEEKTNHLQDCTEKCAAISMDRNTLTTQLELQRTQVTNAEHTVSLRTKAEERIEQRKNELNQLQQSRNKQKEELANLQQQFSSMQATINELQGVMQQQKSTTEIEKNLAATHTTLQTLQEEIASWDTQFLQATSAAAAQKTNIDNAKSALLEAIEKEKTSMVSFEEQCKTATLTSDITITSHLSSMRSSLQDMQAWEEQIQTYTTKTQTVAEQLQRLATLIKNQKPPAIAQLEEQLSQLQLQQDTLAQQVGSQIQHLQTSQKALEQLATITANSKETEILYEQAGRLYQLLSGTNQKKIPLQQFVLGIMLDDILAYANEFFSLLSRGRYNLRRLEGTTGGNAKSGLDLEVLDGFTGAPRSIETLSGGEQFLASLSLAFGLSDVVQSYSGSVRLDSIFIDEGFGSLDQDTLDTAMKALAQIQKMGRTVGIISHVSELKNRIATQICVHPSKNGGSSVTIIKDS